MNYKSILKKTMILSLLIGAFGLLYSQNLGLDKAGQQFLNEVRKAFPYVAGLSFVFVGWKAFNEYNENGKDVMAALKVFIYFAVILLVFIGIFEFVISKSL